MFQPTETDMSDDKQQRGGQDRQRINVNEDYELRDWSKKFGVSEQRLKEAVQAVGDRADKVQAYLGGGERGGSSGGSSGKSEKR
jgi:hypothetical protein